MCRSGGRGEGSRVTGQNTSIKLSFSYLDKNRSDILSTVCIYLHMYSASPNAK
jgi:hypothetical protein